MGSTLLGVAKVCKGSPPTYVSAPPLIRRKALPRAPAYGRAGSCVGRRGWPLERRGRTRRTRARPPRRRWSRPRGRRRAGRRQPLRGASLGDAGRRRGRAWAGLYDGEVEEARPPPPGREGEEGAGQQQGDLPGGEHGEPRYPGRKHRRHQQEPPPFISPARRPNATRASMLAALPEASKRPALSIRRPAATDDSTRKDPSGAVAVEPSPMPRASSTRGATRASFSRASCSRWTTPPGVPAGTNNATARARAAPLANA